MPLTCEIEAERAFYKEAMELFPRDVVRFLKKVDGDWQSGCWNWNAAKDRDNYSSFWGESKTVPGHRWIYTRFRGPIPAGLDLDHLCVRPWCVAPAHLEPVTPDENRRRIAFRREQARAGKPIVIRTGAVSILEMTSAMFFSLPFGGGVVLPGEVGATAMRLEKLMPSEFQGNPYAQNAPVSPEHSTGIAGRAYESF